MREVFFDWLRSQRPDLVPRYERLYARGAYAPRAERERIAALVRSRGATWPRRGAFAAVPAAGEEPAPPEQPSLSAATAAEARGGPIPSDARSYERGLRRVPR